MKFMHFKVLAIVAQLTISAADAGTVIKREFIKDGQVYIEETVVGDKGNTSKSIYPKPGVEKKIKPASDEPPGGLSTLALPSSGLSTQPQSTAAMKRLARAIESCRPYQYTAPHPIVQGFKIKFEVHGLQKEVCKFTETMPNDGLQTCFFTEKHRKEIGSRGSAALETYLGDKNICPIAGY